MYQSSDSPIFPNQQAHLAHTAAASDARIAQAADQSRNGRARVFKTIVSANEVSDSSGFGAGLDTAKLQSQTEVARASGLVTDFPWAPTPAVQPPEVVPMSTAPLVCGAWPGASNRPQSQSAQEAHYSPRVGMPRRAPAIVRGPHGVMHYQGAEGTYPGAQVSRPDAVVQSSWLVDHPWWALVIAAGGVYALSRRAR
jgi:hypothetical protein